MSAFEVNNPFDLLGQAAAPSAPVPRLHGSNEPQLHIAWGEFHQGAARNFAELFRRAKIKNSLLSASFFKDAWIERRVPRRAIFAAALWHVAFIVMPLPEISGPARNHAFDNTQLAWTGPIEDFPQLEIPAARPKSTPRVQTQQPASEGADAFHPRQRIFTDPVHPNHPRQTLINPAAPNIAPKFLPELPNVVQLAQAAAPARPRLEISQQFLKQLHPREKRIATASTTPAPEMLAANHQPADVNLALSAAGPERPKLLINAGVAPRAAQRDQNGAAEPAPEVANQLTSPNGSGQAFIALSANPGPPAPVAPPAGNLAARIAISPEGKKSGGSAEKGESGGSTAAANGAGGSSIGISISGGSPHPANTVSGLGNGSKLIMLSSRPSYTRADAARDAADPPEVRTGPPNFAALAPGAKPEAIFARRRVYSLNVNMPNLNSSTGSWILNFSEMLAPPNGPASGELAEPSPMHKVDPKYPPTAIAEHIEGEVILYGVIRQDGTVDSIQLVRGIDDQLDANAIRAFAQWKFRPAERDGQPVELEAIVHIPFRAPERQ